MERKLFLLFFLCVHFFNLCADELNDFNTVLPYHYQSSPCLDLCSHICDHITTPSAHQKNHTDQADALLGKLFRLYCSLEQLHDCAEMLLPDDSVYLLVMIDRLHDYFHDISIEESHRQINAALLERIKTQLHHLLARASFKPDDTL